MTQALPDGLRVPDDACPAIPSLAPPPPLPRVAWALAGVALAVRAAAALAEPVPPRDAVALAESVRALASGDAAPLLHGPHQPLAVLLAAIPAALGLDPVVALTACAALAGAALTLPLFAVTRRILDDADAASAAALLHAVAPPFVRLESTALSEAPFLLATLASLHFALRALRHFRPGRDAVLAGLLGGAAWLARPEGVVPAAAALAVVLPRGGGRPAANRLRALALAAAGLALAALPWLVARAAWGDGARLFAGKSAAVLAGAASAADLGGAATGEVRGPLGSAVQALGAIPEALHPALVPLVLVGFLSLARFGRCGRTLGPVALPLIYGGAFWTGLWMLEWRYGYGGRRHASATACMLLPFAGAGFLGLARMAGRLRGPLRRPTVALGLLVALVAVPLAVGALLHRDDSGREARALGLALRARAAGGAPLVATFGEPRVAWYAGGTDVRLRREYGVPPGASPAEAAARADALRALLRSAEAPDVLVLREGDERVPAALEPTPGAEPIARAGRLVAWEAGAFR